MALAGLNTTLSDLFADSVPGPIVLIILGMFIDSIGLCLPTAPLILPMANAAVVGLIWFGIILIKLRDIHLMTQPVGLNIFVIQSTRTLSSGAKAHAHSRMALGGPKTRGSQE